MWSTVVAWLLLARASLSHALDISQCIAPLGMESGLIPDQDLTASSSFNDGNVGPQNGRLHQEIKGGAWCPKSQITTESTEWLEIDLHSVHVITGTGTQGRFGNGQGAEYAEAYVLEYWRPKLGKWVRYRAADGQEILTGNTNTYLEKKNHLEPPIWASKIRFIPYSSHRRTVCMRVELYGCYWSGGRQQDANLLCETKSQAQDYTFKHYFVPVSSDDEETRDAAIAMKSHKTKAKRANSIDNFFEKPKKKKKTTLKSSCVGQACSGGVSYIVSNEDDAAKATHFIKIEIYDMDKIRDIAPPDYWKHIDVRVKYYVQSEDDKYYQNTRDVIYNITKQLASTPNCSKYCIENKEAEN